MANISGSSGNDSLRGTTVDDSLDGGAGNDTLQGGGGNDTLTGGLGVDTFVVSTGTATITDLGYGGADVLSVESGAKVTARVFTPWSPSNATRNNGAVVLQSDGLMINLGGLSAGYSGFKLEAVQSDKVTPSTKAVVFSGTPGNDTLVGGKGNDTLVGGAGNDSITGGTGTDFLNGGDGDDVFVFDKPEDLFVGNGIVDSIMGASGTDTIRLDTTAAVTMAATVSFSRVSGVEKLVVNGANSNAISLVLDVTAFTTAGIRTVDLSGDTDTTGSNVIDASRQINTTIALSLLGSAGPDSITGGAGNDTLVGSTEDRLLDGGNGTDVLQIAAAFDDSGDGQIVNLETVTLTVTGLNVNLGDQSENLTISGFATGASTITGGSGSDSITGGSGNDSLAGGAGSDSIGGGAGDDTITGGAGVDTFIIAAGTDSVTDLGNGADVMVVNAGATVNATVGAAWTATSVSSNSGTANVVSSGYAVDLSAITGGVSGFNLSNSGAATTLTGSAQADSLTGGANNDTLSGGAGADTLDGGGGNDSLSGGEGADSFKIGAGTDTVSDLGVGGADVLVVSAGATVNATIGAAWTASSASGNSGTANVTTSGKAVNLAAITAGTTGFKLSNTGTATTLTGSALADSLSGSTGNDTLDGGKGADTLVGGSGIDTFVFAPGDSGQALASIDVIEDFKTGPAGVGDEIRYASSLKIVAGSGGGVAVSAKGIVSFTSTPGSLDAALASVAAQVVGSGELALFQLAQSSDFYLFIGDGVGGLSANDVVVQLKGVTSAARAVVDAQGTQTIIEPLALQGTSGPDTLIGGVENDTLSGNDGADSLSGGEGDDSLLGGTGADLLTGGTGADVFILAGDDTVVDFSSVESDRVDLSGLANGDSVTFPTVTGTLNLSGSTTTARFVANSAATSTTIIGGAGNDSITGAAGNDSIDGGPGDDSLSGGLGTNRLTGSSGNDLFAVATNANDSVSDLATGDALTVAVSGTLSATNVSNFIATSATRNDGSVTINAASSASTINLGAAVGSVGFTLVGGNGDDLLTGSSQPDNIDGGIGADTISGGAGNDTLTGGQGNDRFIVDSGKDSITDLSTGDELVVVSGATAYAGNVRSFIAGSSTTNSGTVDINTGALAGNVNVAAAGGGGSFSLSGDRESQVSDTLIGGANGDKLVGGGGNDYLDGGPGNDTIVGGFEDGGEALDGDDTLIGGDGDDLLYGKNPVNNGGSDRNSLDGGAGSDTLLGGLGNDTLIGGAGNDSLYGLFGRDSIVGGDGDDLLSGGFNSGQNGGAQDDDTMTGGSGADTFIIDDGTDTVTDLESADTIKINPSDLGASAVASNISDFVATPASSISWRGSSTFVAASAGGRIDLSSISNQWNLGFSLAGGQGSDTLAGSGGSDTITGGAGNDSITAGAGNDTIVGADSGDTIVGGVGSDTLQLSGNYTPAADGNLQEVESVVVTGNAAAVTVNLSNHREAFTVLLSGLGDSVTTGSGDDTITGGSGADSISAGAGNDVIVGADSGDTFVGGIGSDTLQISGNYTPAADGNLQEVESLVVTGNRAAVTVNLSNQSDAFTVSLSGYGDSVTTGSGSDVIYGGGGKDSILAGDGNDTIKGSLGDDTINGGGGDDVITGGEPGYYNPQGFYDGSNSFEGNKVIDGGLGNDTINGGVGDDILLGGEGNDVIDGKQNSDSIDGGSGSDILVGGTGNDTIRGGAGNDLIKGGNDFLRNFQGGAYLSTSPGSPNYEGDKLLDGGDGEDTVFGGSGRDTLLGGTGNDSLLGLESNDSLDGGAGNDTLIGGVGDDTLTGGAGADVIDGGAGVDTAVYAAGATFALNSSTPKWEVTGGEDSTTDVLENVEVIKIGNVANLVGSLAVVQSTVSALQGAGSLPSDFNAIISDAAGATLAAGALSALGGKTTGVVTVSDAVVISGTAAEVTAALVTADTLVLAGSAKVTVTDSIAVSAVNAIASKTSGVITATITEGGVATIKTLTGTGNAYTITLSDTSADIADLIAMNDRTPVPVDARSVATITSASTTNIDLTAAGVTWKSGITVSGTAGDDSISATAGNDSITGGAGNDSITGGDGNDTVVGADSGDTIVGGAGADSLQLSGNYTPAADGSLQEVESVVITGNTAAVTVNLSNQSEAFTVLLSGLGDSVTTGSGADNITGGTGADTLDGGSGADTLTGGAGLDSLDGGEGDDIFVFASAAELQADATVIGGSGSDTVSMQTGSSALVLADTDFAKVTGMETLALEGTGTQAVTLGTNANAAYALGITITAQATATSLNLQATALTRAISVSGTANNDTLAGGTGNDTITGGGGDDTITGGAGVDSLDGGAGNDIFVYAALADLMAVGKVVDSIADTGATGTDTIRIDQALAYTIVGGDSFSRVSGVEVLAQGVANAANISITLGTTAFDAGIRTVTLAGDTNATGANTLNASAATSTQALTLVGSAGADTITGGAGADSLDGGAGSDTYVYAAFADLMVAGKVVDSIADTGATGTDTIRIDQALAAYTIAAEDSFSQVSGVEVLAQGVASGFDLSITLDATAFAAGIRTVSLAADTVAGGANTLNASEATSTQALSLVGSAGVDSITGGAGDDTITGGAGADSLDGGAGSDTYVYAAFADLMVAGNVVDSIADTGAAGTDTIRIDQALAYTIVGGDSFSRVSGVEVLAQGVANAANISITLGTTAFDAGIRTVSLAADTVAGGANTLNASAATQALTLVGSAGVDSITGGAGADSLTGGAGADVLVGGAGRDTFVYASGATGQTDTTLDVISDFQRYAVNAGAGAGDVIAYASSLSIGGTGALATGSEASIDRTTAVASFASGSGTTLGDALADVAARIGANAAGQFALFQVNQTGGYYLFISDSVLGVGANDVVVSMPNVTEVKAVVVQGTTLEIGADNNSKSGTAGNDKLTGGTGDDTLSGGAGDDTITGGAGADSLRGEAGNDTITGDGGGDTIDGGSGDDVIVGSQEDALLDGGDGSDVLELGASFTAASDAQLVNIETVSLTVSGLNVVLSNQSEPLMIRGPSTGTSSITGGTGNDTITGGGGDDTITGGAGVDSLDGGAGNDIFVYAALADLMAVGKVVDSIADTGATGTDTIRIDQALAYTIVGGDSFSRVSGVEVLAQGVANAANISITLGTTAFDAGIRTVTLAGDTNATGANTLNASAATSTQALTLVGSAGADTITGGAGADSLDGGAGSDTYVYAAFADLMVAGKVVDSIADTGATGTDTIRIDQALAAYTIAAEDSFSQVSGVEVLAQGVASGFDLSITLDATAFAAGIRTVSLAADTVAGGANTLNASEATSTQALSLVGSAGVDSITGGAGDDTITGGAGADSLDGGAGSDTYVYAAFADLMVAGNVVDSIADTGAAGTDTIRIDQALAYTIVGGDSFSRVSGVEVLAQGVANAANISITLGTTAFDAGIRTVSLAADTVAGGANTLNASAATQALTLVGSAGVDSITGGAGADSLTGGAGADVLVGGAGRDTFVYASGATGQTDTTLDVISDFQRYAVTAGAGAGDVIAYASSLSIGGTGALATGSEASIDRTTAVASFASGSGTTLGDALADVAARIGANAAGQFALFQVNQTGGYYLFISDSVLGVGANDVVVSMPNVTEVKAVVVQGTTLEIGADNNSKSGTAGNDKLTGGTGDDTLSGGAGDDTITGGAGADSLRGEAGNDTITGDGGGDTIDGGSGDDVIVGSQEDALLDGGDGSDVLELGASFTAASDAQLVNIETVSLTVSGLNVVLSNQSEPLMIRGPSTGTSSITGGTGNDTITGGGGDDTITGGAGVDSLDGGAGNDIFVYAALADLMAVGKVVDSIADTGATGTDTIRIDQALAYTIVGGDSFSRVSGVEVLAQGVANAANISITLGTTAFDAGIRTVTLAGDTNATGANTLNASAATSTQALTLVGSAGADTITGGAGADSLDGGAGSDTYVYAAFADLMVAGKVVDSIADTGATGTDTIRIDQALAAYTIAAEDSFSQVSGVEVLAQGVASGFDLSITLDATAFAAGIRTVSLAADTVAGGANTLNASEATSTQALSLVGSAGVDSITGGAGDDTITGGAGADSLDGGAGSDTYVYAAFADLMVAGNVVDSIADTGAAGTDTIRIDQALAYTIVGGDSFSRVSGVEVLAQGAANTANISITLGTTAFDAGIRTVTLAGDTSNLGANTLNAATSTQALTLVGSAGVDSITGGAGADSLTGGAGADVLVGGAGRDTFVYASGATGQTDTTLDVISDFQRYAVNAGAGAGDVIAYASSLSIGGTGALATGSEASIDRTTAVASFASGSGTTLGDALADVAARIGANAAGQFALFQVNQTGGYYLFISDSVLGVGANDVVVSMPNVTEVKAVVVQGTTLEIGADNNSKSGTAGNDKLTGGTGDDTLSGGAGDDTITGGAGADSLRGEAGNDTITGDGGGDTIDGGSGDDVIVGSQEDALLDGGDGSDVLELGASFTAASDAQLVNIETVSLTVSGLNVVLSNQSEPLMIRGPSTGTSSITGGTGNDTITGGGGDDTITGGAGVDSLDGGAGNDIFVYAALADLMAVGKVVDSIADTGATGTDTIRIDQALAYTIVGGDSFSRVSGVEVLAQGVANAANISITLGTTAFDAGIRTVTLAGDTNATGANTLNASAATSTQALTLVGSAGADTITGGAGADSLDGGAGSDTYVYAAFADLMVAGKVVDSIADTGATGTDTIRIDQALAAYTIAAEDSFSQVSGVEVLAQGVASGFDLSITLDATAFAAGIRTVSLAADTVAGGANTLNASEATSTQALSLVGSAGVDSITGGAGDDTITGGAGADSLDGGAGSDTYVYAAFADLMVAGNVVDSIADTGAAGTDTIRIDQALAYTIVGGDSFSRVSGVEVLAQGVANAANISITLGTTAFDAGIRTVSLAADTVAGGANTLNASAATQALTLVGSAGVDSITGGAGADSLTGGAGADVLVGGAGRDTFVYASGATGQTDTTLDVISDFQRYAVNAGAGAGDVIAYASSLSIGGTGALATGSEASIDRTTAVASFASGSGTTLGDALADVAARIGANAAGQFALFQVNQTGGYYLFISDSVLGVGANDVVVSMPNVTEVKAVVVQGTTLEIGADNNSKSGTAGNDKLTGGTGDDTLSGGAGDDTITGGAGADSLRGEAGNDTITGDGGGDTIDGGSGDDVIVGSQEDALLDGGDGSDVLELGASFTAASDAQLVNIETVSLTVSGLNVVLSNQSEPLMIRGPSTGTSSITGGTGNDTITGGGGDDTITGGAGVDSLDGGAGNDIFVYAALADLMAVGKVEDSIADTGVTGTDTIRIDQALAYTIVGGDSFSRVSGVEVLAQGVANAANISITLGTTAFDAGIRTVTLAGDTNATGANTLNASAATSTQALTLVGSAGADTITGGAGADSLDGGAGSDTYVYAAFADLMVDRKVVDSIADTGVTGTDTIRIDATAGYTIDGTADFARLSGIETLSQGATSTGAISITLDATAFAAGIRTVSLAADTVAGGANTLNASEATSTQALSLVGSAGVDSITGGAGDDTITGGAGADSLDGGAGSDTYVYAAFADLMVAGNVVDSIADTGAAGTDTIRIDQALAYTIVGGDSFSRVSGVEVLAQGAANTANISITLGTTAFDAGIRTVTLAGDTSNLGANTLNAATSTQALTLVGSAGVDSITGGAGADSLTGGAGADVLVGGAGRDTFVYASGATGQTDTTLDVISDFQRYAVNAGAGAGDVIAYASSLSIGGTGALATGSEASIDRTTAVASFASGSGTTLGDALADVAARIGANAAGQFALFQVNQTGGYYLFISDSVLGVGANDVVVSMPNVTEVKAVVVQGTTLEIGADNNSKSGTAGNDKLTGGTGDDTLSGGAGDDTITGGAGADSLRGEAGNDTITGDGGGDTIDGGSGDDVIVGSQEDALLDGGDGSDVLELGASFTAASDAQLVNIETVSLTVSGLNVVLSNQSEPLMIRGPSTGTSSITGGTGNDTITGGGGDDTITGGAGVDSLDGGAGNDIFVYAALADLMAVGKVEDSIADTGVTGTDTIRIDQALAYTIVGGDSFSRVSGVEVLAQGVANAANISITLGTTAFDAGIRTVTLAGDTNATGANTLNASAATSTQALTLVGSAGADTITGGAGADSLDGGAGSDTYVYAAFADLMVDRKVVDSIADTGVTGTDTIRIDATAGYTIDGTADFARLSGIETLSQGATSTGAISITLDATAFAAGIRTVSLAADTVAGGANTLNASEATSTQALSLVGSAGVDSITGGAGDDTITGGAGADSLDGGAGSDTYVYAAFADLMVAGNVVDSIADTGAAGTDTIRIDQALAYTIVGGDSFSRVSGVEVLAQGAANTANISITLGTTAFDAGIRTVTLAGDTSNLGANTLNAATSTQALTLVGSAGVDSITGGAGADSLTGGAGADVLVGGAGRDTFVYASGATGQTDTTLDVISDFQRYAVNAGAGAGDVIAYASSLSIGGTGALATGSEASIDRTTAVASFASGSGTTLGDALADVAARIGANAAGQFALFQVNQTGGYYLFISDSVLGVGANDVVVSMPNVTEVKAVVVQGTTLEIGADNNSKSGTAGNDKLTGGTGDDTLSGGAGDDTITGGAGLDSLDGGEGDDIFVFASAAELQADATVIGGSGSDTVSMQTGSSALVLADTDFAKVTGMETLALEGTGTQAVTLGTNANAAYALGITITAQATATSLNLQATALTRAISVSGTANNDTLVGGTGNDTITGGGGDDTITGGAGVDSLDGGAGNDIFVYAALTDLLSVDSVVGGGGTADTIRIDQALAAYTIAAVDSFSQVSGVEVLAQGAANAANISITLGTTAFTAGMRTVTLAGDTSATGTNTLNASAATSTQALSLVGSAGVDTITGGAGDDTITGGGGNDNLTGGAGADRFVFASTAALNGTDTLADFVAGGVDVLDFSAFNIDANGEFNTPLSLSAVLTSNPSNSTQVAGTIVRLVEINSGQDITTASGLQTALATGGEYANLDMTPNSKAIFITSATDSDSDADYIFFATSNATGVITVALVGQTAANSDIDSYRTTGFGI